MKVSVFGLGYVGAVSSACLAKIGHEVIGVDTQVGKVHHINAGESPILEEGISELVSEMVSQKRLRATVDAVEAVRETDLSIVCVGTPSAPTGKLDLSYLASVSQDIGAALAKKTTHHTLVVRSTVLPGTTQTLVLPILEARSGRPIGEGYSVFYNPEFLREGTAIADFFGPPLTLVGTFDGKPADPVEKLYAGIEAPLHTVSIQVAEMMKYSSNAFHALKITFANEIGRIAKKLGADSYRVMDYLCRDTKLNISKAYLLPGFAFGGSCLPKDLRALTYKAKELDVSVPMLSAILSSNEEHIESALRIIQDAKTRKVGLLGLSFKPGTDDLRESPLVALAERLIGKGYELCVYDPLVNLDHLVGANKTYILREIPHISRLMVSSVDKVLAAADVIVVGNGSKEFACLENHEFAEDQTVVDLAGILKGAVKGKAAYHGICW